MPASRSIVPGEPSPTAAMWSQSSPASWTAFLPAAARLSTPTPGPWSAWVGTLIEESGRPASSTTPLLIFVPPRSMPRK